jgi:hypothetical protein
MIWDLLYMCFMEAPINSELERALVYVIHNGSPEQAKEVLEKYCK